MKRQDNQDRTFVLVITFGRSGSTLLQGVLNTIPNACVRGENNNSLVYLQQFYDSLNEAKKLCYNADSTTTQDPWFGIDQVDMASVQERLRDLITSQVLSVPDDAAWIGFKEIRYGWKNFKTYEALRDYILFLRLLFPGLRLVFNYRSPQATMKSGWWPEVENAARILANIEKKMRQAYDEFRPISFWVEYENYTKRPESLQELFTFLGASYNADAVRKVFAKKHSI
jgi:hypothetical protein